VLLFLSWSWVLAKKWPISVLKSHLFSTLYRIPYCLSSVQCYWRSYEYLLSCSLWTCLVLQNSKGLSSNSWVKFFWNISLLETEAAGSSKTLVPICQTILCHPRRLICSMIKVYCALHLMNLFFSVFIFIYLGILDNQKNMFLCIQWNLYSSFSSGVWKRNNGSGKAIDVGAIV
jgi:hypothetical protein